MLFWISISRLIHEVIWSFALVEFNLYGVTYGGSIHISEFGNAEHKFIAQLSSIVHDGDSFDVILERYEEKYSRWILRLNNSNAECIPRGWIFQEWHRRKMMPPFELKAHPLSSFLLESEAFAKKRKGCTLVQPFLFALTGCWSEPTSIASWRRFAPSAGLDIAFSQKYLNPLLCSCVIKIETMRDSNRKRLQIQDAGFIISI